MCTLLLSRDMCALFANLRISHFCMFGLMANRLSQIEHWCVELVICSATRVRTSFPCNARSNRLQIRCSVKELLEKGEAWHAKVREALAQHRQ